MSVRTAAAFTAATAIIGITIAGSSLPASASTAPQRLDAAAQRCGSSYDKANAKSSVIRDSDGMNRGTYVVMVKLTDDLTIKVCRVVVQGDALRKTRTVVSQTSLTDTSEGDQLMNVGSVVRYSGGTYTLHSVVQPSDQMTFTGSIVVSGKFTATSGTIVVDNDYEGGDS